MVLVSRTGTGKTHLAVARMCIGSGATGRFYNVVGLVNQLETATAVILTAWFTPILSC